jgi:GTP-binding protein EngB required for normal cell division
MDEFLVHEGEVLDDFLKTKGESVVDDATFLMKQFKTLFKDVSRNLQKPNVLLTGITGAGKSSLINTMFGKNVAATGTGIPITQHFTKYDDDDMRIVIYDSKGLEHGEFEDFIETTTDFFEEHSIGVHGESEDAIHVIWYILNSASSRFEPFEQRICRELFNRAPIMFLLNKADISTEEDRNNLRQLINDMNLPNCVGIFDVMASPVARYKHFKVCPNNKCNSDDLAIRKRTGIMECLECGHQEPIILDDGLSTTIKATVKVLPAVVRDAFISAQTVSFHVKEESSRAILEEFWNEFPTVRTRAKLLKIVAKMMARLSIVWEFKNNGHLYGSMMAKNLVSALKWKDKMNLLFGKKLQA